MSPSIEEIDWTPKPVLRPGMDFHDGVTYFTTPLTRNILKPGRGKDAESTLVKELQTYVITSNHKGFWYDEESLDIVGFIPSEQVYQERSPNWSRESVKDFLDRKSPVVQSKDAFKDLRDVYVRYVEYTDDTSYDLMALFVMYTYVFRLFESTGYVHFNGTQASGKSRNLAILNALAFNTVWASSMSAASLYRKLAGSPGTTCIDESEGFEGERGEELRRILNAGYKDGARAIRTEKTKGDRYMPVEYDVFGPKALASINPLEQVIASRCVVIGMRPAIRQLPDFEMNHPQWRDLRDHLYLWAMDNAPLVSTCAHEWRTEKKERLAPRLIGRQWEVTSQFIILADIVGGEKFATKVIDYLNTYFGQQQASLDATDRLRTTLRALPRVLALKAPHPGNFYSVKDIHEVVSSYLEEDAREYFKTKHVGKNLDTIGFREKVRATGGVRYHLEEDALRAEFKQRKVEVMDEDKEWLDGTRSYQNLTQAEKEEAPVVVNRPPRVEATQRVQPVFYAYIPGQAVPQGSKTAFVSKSTGRPIVVDKDVRLPRWRATITHAAQSAIRARSLQPLEGPLYVNITFVMERPRGHYGTGKNAHVIKKSSPTHPARMPDIDKLLRAVFDGLTDAHVWYDDAQVVWVQAAKKYRDMTPLDGPGVHVWVEPTP